MLEKIKDWIDKNKLLNKGEKILAACSGGPDSVVLVHSLWMLRSEYNTSVVVAHVDHMFRGKESKEDADFVQALCHKLGVACYRTAIDVPKFIAESKRSPQDAARELRYKYLYQVAHDINADKIAIGHQRDDQAETILINLLRGAGGTGLGGIKTAKSCVIRPLMGVDRKYIDDYCKEHQLNPRIDSSNFKTDYLRNKIRLKLLPELEQNYNSSIREALCRTAEIVGTEHAFIRETVLDLWSKVIREDKGKVLINRKQFSCLHLAQQREFLRMVIEKKRGNTRGITFYHVEKFIEKVIEGQVGSVLELPGQQVVQVGYEEVELRGVKPLESKTHIKPIKLDIPGVTNIPELNIAIEAEVMDTPPLKEHNNTAIFDLQQLSPPIYIRTRTEGDRFQPVGMKGSKKLKDFFIDDKIPREKRDVTPIVYDSEGILWVGGYRQAEHGKTTVNTQQFLQLTLNTGRNKND